MEERPERTIYIIGASRDGPVKIGVSNDADKRLRQLQTAQEKQLIVFAAEPCRATHALALERLIHAQINHKRMVGEWFDIDVETAIAEVRFGIIRWESDDHLDRKLKKKRLVKS